MIIWASPDTDGLTAAAKDAVAEGILSTGADVQEMHLNRKNVKSCMTCGKGGYGTCFSKGKCTIRDDMQEIYDAMCRANALVLLR